MIIVRYGEIGLKGKNRKFFEKKLVENIKDCLKRNSFEGTVVRRESRILVDAPYESLSVIKNVFGIVSISYAKELPLDYEIIKQEVLEYAQSKQFNTFRITCNRPNKKFPKTSMEIERELGELIFETLKKPVSLKEPQENFRLEIMEKVYLFTEKIEGFGGLPAGIEGNVAVLIENEYSQLAAWLMMKRGCNVYPVAYEEKDLLFIQKYAYGQKLSLKIIKTTSDLNEYMEEYHCKALVVNDCDINTIRQQETQAILLRPLIGMTQEEVKELYTRLV